MTASQAFLIAGGIFAFMLLLVGLSLVAWLVWRRQQAVSQGAHITAAGIGELKQAVEALTVVARDLPALERGLIEVSREQVAVLTALREDHQDFNANISKLYGSLFAKDSNAYQEYDERQSGQAYRAQELIEKGIAPDEALARAHQEETSRVYSRQSLGV